LARKTARHSLRELGWHEVRVVEPVANHLRQAREVQDPIDNADAGAAPAAESCHYVGVSVPVRVAQGRDASALVRAAHGHVDVAVLAHGQVPRGAETFGDHDHAEAVGQDKSVVVRCKGQVRGRGHRCVRKREQHHGCRRE